MKVTFQTQDLCHALERVQRAAQTKVTSNTNNGFFISAEDGKVEFQANDYSIGIRTFCEADVEERGSVLISAPHLLSTIKMMPSGPVVMEQKKGESTVFFKAGQYNSHFPTRDTAEFPLVTEIDHTFHVNMKCKDFAEMVNLVSFAASTDAILFLPVFSVILMKTYLLWPLRIPIVWRQERYLLKKYRREKGILLFPLLYFRM